MAIDTSEFKFPKPSRKSGKKAKGKKKQEKPDYSGMFENEVDQMVSFYEQHRNDMASIENFRYTSKLKDQAAKWIIDVMRSQKCDDTSAVISAWEQTVIHAAEKVHASHKAGSFMNFFWIIKNDYNFLEILDGKYDKEFKSPKKSTAGWGGREDFNGNGTVPANPETDIVV